MNELDEIAVSIEDTLKELDTVFLKTLNLTMQDIQSFTLDDINHLINILDRHRKELDKQRIEQEQKDAAKNIGRCFKLGKSYVKVIGIPQPESTMTGIVFNKYQYPAVWIDESLDDPIYHDNLFINGTSIGNYSLRTRIVPIEITLEEFTEKLKQVNDNYVQKILEIKT